MKRILRGCILARDTVEDWKRYPFSIPAVAKLEELEFHPAVTYFIGDNGSGKSNARRGSRDQGGF